MNILVTGAGGFLGRHIAGALGKVGHKVLPVSRRHGVDFSRMQACATAKVRKVVQMSALGADDTAFSAYHLSKRAADDCLRGLDVDGLVLRPSLVYGPGGQSAALFMRVAAWPLIPVLGDGQQMRQPVRPDLFFSELGASS